MVEGGLRLDSATFELTKKGEAAWDFSGTHGKLSFSGTMTVDPDGLPREVTLGLRMGTITFRRTE